MECALLSGLSTDCGKHEQDSAVHAKDTAKEHENDEEEKKEEIQRKPSWIDILDRYKKGTPNKKAVHVDLTQQQLSNDNTKTRRFIRPKPNRIRSKNQLCLNFSANTDQAIESDNVSNDDNDDDVGDEFSSKSARNKSRYVHNTNVNVSTFMLDTIMRARNKRRIEQEDIRSEDTEKSVEASLPPMIHFNFKNLKNAFRKYHASQIQQPAQKAPFISSNLPKIVGNIYLPEGESSEDDKEEQPDIRILSWPRSNLQMQQFLGSFDFYAFDKTTAELSQYLHMCLTTFLPSCSLDRPIYLDRTFKYLQDCERREITQLLLTALQSPTQSRSVDSSLGIGPRGCNSDQTYCLLDIYEMNGFVLSRSGLYAADTSTPVIQIEAVPRDTRVTIEEFVELTRCILAESKQRDLEEKKNDNSNKTETKGMRFLPRELLSLRPDLIKRIFQSLAKAKTATLSENPKRFAKILSHLCKIQGYDNPDDVNLGPDNKKNSLIFVKLRS